MSLEDRYKLRQNMENQDPAVIGVGFFGLLCIAFIVLKLCDVIAWSWVWVLAPLWICAAFWIALLLVVILVLLLTGKLR